MPSSSARRPNGLARTLNRLTLGGLALAVLPLSGCIDEETVTLPVTTNAVRNRSVRIDADSLLVKTGASIKASTVSTKTLHDYTGICVAGEDCKAWTAPVTDGLKVAGLRGVNGAPIAAVPTDDNQAFKDNFGSLHTYWTRIPVGYGCEALLQGMVQDDGKKDITKIESFNHTRLDELIGAARKANTLPIWTAGYHLGSPGEACVYENGEVKGKAITNPARWAKAVRTIAKYYDRDLPTKNAEVCKNTPKGQPLSWDCGPTLFNIEFGRDPFGAGGFVDTNRQQWLDAYKAFATELRQEFPVPGNDVNLIAPSIVLKGAVSVADKTSKSRSPIYDFIDFVVAGKLPLSFLSMEIEAKTPADAYQIVKSVAEYAADKGLKSEKGLYGGDGTKPIPIWVTDLRISELPKEVKPLADPKNAAYDPARYSAYKGAFYASTKVLWQGLVEQAVVGNAPRFPTKDPATTLKDDLANTAKDSDFFWFGATQAPSGSLKPAAWYSFWFNEGFLASKESVYVQHGPDALGTSGSKATSSKDEELIVLATRESCLDHLGNPMDCVADSAKNPAVNKGRKNMIRVLVADFELNSDTGKEVLEHNLRVQIDGLPKDAKSVGYRWAFMDGTSPTWNGFVFPEQGVLDVATSGGSQPGTFHFTRLVPTPSLHYFEFLF